MTTDTLAKLFEHNNWANHRIIESCSALSDEQLDARPRSDSTWSIRRALSHLVEAQQGYLSLLNLPPEARQNASLPFAGLQESAGRSGEGLLALAREDTSPDSGTHPRTTIRTKDGYHVEPWVVMVQAINHATDHRRQISGLLRALGVDPPVIDGWGFGEHADALVPIPT